MVDGLAFLPVCDVTAGLEHLQNSLNYLDPFPGPILPRTGFTGPFLPDRDYHYITLFDFF